MPPMGTVPLGFHDLRLYICLHTHISIYVYTVCVREYINSNTTLYEQFLNDSDNHESYVHGKFKVTGNSYVLRELVQQSVHREDF